MIRVEQPEPEISPSARKTIISFLLDESGSMEGIRDDTIGGFNAFVRSQQEAPGDLTMTLIKFDSQNSRNEVFRNVPIKQVRLLSRETFVPRGGTPLVDAAYSIIKETEEQVARTPGKPNVLVIIQTDGQENSSTAHTTADLKALIETKQAQGWAFTFLGAGIDSYTIANSIGIKRDATSSYGLGQSAASFHNLNTHVHNFRATGSVRAMNYTSAELKSQGDAFVHRVEKDGKK